jgi:Tol biopolymer transport system component
MNRGFSKALYYLFGEQITGGILGLYIPSWFLEGDATVTETALTRTGRGRSALFESVLRAQLLEKGMYRYDKATMGSYRTFTPDAYELGYFLVGASRARYGTALWNEALDRTAKFPFMVVPFNSGIRKVTGKWKVPLYKETMASLDSGWRIQLTHSDTTGIKPVTRRNTTNYTHYIRPRVLNDSMLVAGRSSMDDLDRFVMIDIRSGKEKTIVTPGNYLSGSHQVSGNLLTWLDYRPDPRWAHRSYNRILVMDLIDKSKRVVVSRSRYFSAVPDNSGTRMAAIRISENNECAVVLLSMKDGAETGEWHFPGYQNVANPAWTPDGLHLILTITTPDGKTLSSLDLKTGMMKELFAPVYRDIRGTPVFHKGYILFSADFGGIQDVYAYDTLSKACYKVTSARFGMTDPVSWKSGDEIVLSDYCADGMMISRFRMEPSGWVPLQQVSDRSVRLYDKLALQEGVNLQDSLRLSGRFSRFHPSGPRDSTNVNNAVEHPSKKYNRLTHLFNPHSWAPVSIDAANLELNPGVMVLSQNLLSTMVAGAGWEYSIQEQTGNFYATLQYEGWYPVISARFDAGNRSGYYTGGTSGARIRYTWQETKLKPLVSVPLTLSRGRNITLIQPSAGGTFIYVNHNASTPEMFVQGWITTLDYRVVATHYRRFRGKDLQPSFGFSAELNFRHSPVGINQVGTIASAEVTTWLPGFIRHQGWWFYGGYQQRTDGNTVGYSYGDLISYPRGYPGLYGREAATVKGNYTFPIGYPDLSLGSLIYLKRLRMNLFYDAGVDFDLVPADVFQSVGGELMVDFHALRFVYPIALGVRALYAIPQFGWSFGFLYSISIP